MAMSSIFVKSFQITALASAVALAGCGGKNDTLPNTSVTPSTNNSTTGTDTTGTNTGTNTSATETQPAVKITALELTDATGSLTSLVTSSNNVTASVKVTDGTGAPISGALVKFTAEGVKLGTSNNSVLTNAEGVAKISVTPADLNSTGAYTISASVTHKGETAESGNTNFSLKPAELKITNFDIDRASLESGGSTNVTLVTTDGTNIQNNIAVDFSASCGSFKPASVTSSNQGNVATTYSAIDDNNNLCEGEQTITARLATGGEPVQGKLTIASITPSAIMYTTEEEVKLVSKTSGSATTGMIEFTVYANGTPVRNQDVIVSKEETPPDFSFGSAGNTRDVTFKSNSEGKVVVNLYPGAVPGAVELRATLASNKTISVVSKNVAVVQSRAVQNGVTLITNRNVLLNNYDDSTSVTIRLTNRNGTTVPAGTTVNFVAEGGMITPSCSTNSEGACSVTFTSQNPRPANGRVSILAYLEGEKQYIDVDGDNIYTANKDRLTSNIGDLFRDDNENNQYDADEGEFIYRRNAGTSACKADVPMSSLTRANLYDFLNFFTMPNIQNTCNNDLTATIRHQVIFGLADEVPTFDGLETIRNGLNIFYMYGNNQKTVSMPSGTRIELTSEDQTQNNKECKAEMPSGAKEFGLVDLSIVNDKGNFFEKSEITRYGMFLSNCEAGDRVVITVNAPAPSNKETKVSLTLQ